MADNRISEIIQNQLPSFFTEEGSNLPVFMTKYFEFLESYQIEYTDLELDEYNIVQEDDDGAYYVRGTAIDQRELVYEPSDGAESTDAGMQYGHFYPVYGNKAPAIAASDDGTIYELELEELRGNVFYMPRKGGANGGNYGIAIKDPPSASYTAYTAASRIVKEDSPEDGKANTEIIVESERGEDATFAIGEVIIGATSGAQLIVTGYQRKNEPAGKFLETANTASPKYNLNPHLLFARPINGRVLIHGESIRGRLTRAKATVGETDKDLLRNPLRGAADIDLMTDVDAADNYMLQQFREDFLSNIPFDAIGDLRQAIKTARDIYRSRGTEDSFLWLWRTVYGSDQLSFIYPKERLLRPSDGDWSSAKSIKLYTGTAINPDEFNSKVIKGEDSQATATVDNSIAYIEGSTAVTELYLTDYVKGYDARFDIYSDFQPGEKIATIEAFVDTEAGLSELMNSPDSSDAVKAMAFPAGSSRGDCIAVIGDITIVSNGTGYKVNDELVIKGGAGQGASARVSATANGAIDEIIVDDGGNGYMGGEMLIVNSAGTQGTNHTGAIRGILETGTFRDSNSTIDKVISTAGGGLAPSAISLNAFSFSVDDPGDVRYPENINTHFSSSNSTTWVAEVTNQDTADGGANILLEEGDGLILIDSTDGSADAGDNILMFTSNFEDAVQPGYYVYDSKTGTKGTIAGPSVNSTCFVYVIENESAANFVENSYGDLYYSANATAVPGKSQMFQIASIKPASYYETNQLGDNTYSIDSYYGATKYTYTSFGAIANVQVITTGVDYLKGPSYEASNQTILGKKAYEFEDPITGKNTAELSYLNFAENVQGKYRFGEYVIGQTSGKKAQVVQPYINSTANSTASSMKVKEVDTTFSLEDESVILSGLGTFENNTSALYSFSTKGVGGAVVIASNGNETWDNQTGDTGNNTLSIEASNTIYGSYSGKIAVNDQLETYVGLKGLNNSTGADYENLLNAGNEYIGRISFRASTVLSSVVLRYGHSKTDVNFVSDGAIGGLTNVDLYSQVGTNNADQIYTYEGKFTVDPTNNYHAIYLYIKMNTSTTYTLHVDKIEMIDVTTRGKLEYEGFNTADEPESFMIMEPSEFAAGETVVSLAGARTAVLASANVQSVESTANYGNNAVLKSGALKTGAIKALTIAQAGINYTTVPTVTAPSGDNNATFTANRTTITNYPGTFKTKLGMISDIIRVQDSYYYQDFSYVLRSDIQIGTFRDMVRSFVHPAGWAVFGEIGIEFLIHMSIDTESVTNKKLELFVDRTPAYVTQYGPIDKDMRMGYNRTMMPFDSEYGQIDFDWGIIHNYHIEFLDPRCIGFGATTDDKHFAFHLGRQDSTTWLNGLGWDYEKDYAGNLAGQFGVATPYNSSDAGRVEITHWFIEHDQTNALNESTKIAPWYPNVIAEYVIPGHYEGNECTGHSAGGGVSLHGKDSHYNTENRFNPQTSTNAAGAYAGAQRPPETFWGLGGDGNPNLVRKGGFEYWPEIGILGKYTSPDGNETMPLVTTHVSYGEEEVELIGDATITVISWKEPTLPIRMATASLPNLTSVDTYVKLDESKVKIQPFDNMSIDRQTVNWPNAADRIITVTISSTDYHFDGVNINDSAWTRKLIKGVTYRFNVEDSTNSGHILRFANLLDGKHAAGYAEATNQYPYNAVGTPGSGGAYVDFKIPDFDIAHVDGSGSWSKNDTVWAYCHNHPDMGGPVKTEEKIVVNGSEWMHVKKSLGVDTPDTAASGIYRDPTYEYGQSYARPKDKRLNNPLRDDNKFEVAVANIKAGHVVGLRTDGTIQQVYQTGNVCFPRINYVHSLLGIVQSDGAVGEFVEVHDTDSTEEKVWDLVPGAEYYPNYSANSANLQEEAYVTTTPPTITSADALDRIKLGKADTKDSLNLSFPRWELYTYQAHENLVEGNVVGLMSNGKVQKVFCEADGTAKPQLDGVHSLLGIVKADCLLGDWVEVITKDQTHEMATFFQGADTNFTWATDTDLYVDYRDASVKLNVAYSNHPLNKIGKSLAGQQGTEQTVLVTCDIPTHGTYSPTWDKTKASWPWNTYCRVSTVPHLDDIVGDSTIEEYAGLGIELTMPQNDHPVENLESGQSILFDDINIILEEADGMLLEDGDEVLVEDGTTDATSAMGKLKIENEYLLYEDLINTGSDYKRINIYSRFDAKYIVGNYTTSSFNVHERANKYFPEGRSDHAAQHAVLE